MHIGPAHRGQSPARAPCWPPTPTDSARDCRPVEPRAAAPIGPHRRVVSPTYLSRWRPLRSTFPHARSSLISSPPFLSEASKGRPAPPQRPPIYPGRQSTAPCTGFAAAAAIASPFW
jgi:hypothetical protein